MPVNMLNCGDLNMVISRVLCFKFYLKIFWRPKLDTPPFPHTKKKSNATCLPTFELYTNIMDPMKYIVIPTKMQCEQLYIVFDFWGGGVGAMIT